MFCLASWLWRWQGGISGRPTLSGARARRVITPCAHNGDAMALVKTSFRGACGVKRSRHRLQQHKAIAQRVGSGLVDDDFHTSPTHLHLIRGLSRPRSSSMSEAGSLQVAGCNNNLIPPIVPQDHPRLLDTRVDTWRFSTFCPTKIKE